MALVIIPQEEALHQVTCPEQQRDPVHHPAEPRVSWQEGLTEWDGEQIKANECQSAEVPGQAEVTVGENDGLATAMRLAVWVRQRRGVSRAGGFPPLVPIHEGVQVLSPRVDVQHPLPCGFHREIAQGHDVPLLVHKQGAAVALVLGLARGLLSQVLEVHVVRGDPGRLELCAKTFDLLLQHRNLAAILSLHLRQLLIVGS
mmetsp:Transcript_63331/g.204113  ORF Transcript_63331/g.204113 Transcript_63331/m.204113 type:complete len:201 (-) Transcript_63331:151-753(-)